MADEKETSGGPASPGRLPNVRTTNPPKPKQELLPPVEPPAGFRTLEQQEMGTWDVPGKTVLGYFLGLRESTKYPGRQLFDVSDDDGQVFAWPAPVILAQLLRGVHKGQAVFIYYRGQDGDTKHFDVSVAQQARNRDNG